MSMIQPFPLIEISGPPRERGRQYGRQAAARIHKGTSLYLNRLKELSLDSSGVLAAVRDYLPAIEAFEPIYIEEMHGIAEGAGVPLRRCGLAQCAYRDPQAGRTLRRGRPRRLHRHCRAAASDQGRTPDSWPTLTLSQLLGRPEVKASEDGLWS